MSKLDLEKVDEPEIKLLTSAGTQIKEGNSKKKKKKRALKLHTHGVWM